jgi:hypothetical protein
MAVSFENHGREERRLEAVGAPFADDAAEAAQGGPSTGLLVVGERVQELLDGRRRAQLRDDPALARRVAASFQSPAP